MGLYPCPECGKKVSEHADQCFGCGAPLEFKSGKFFELKDWPNLLGILMVIGLGYFVFLSPFLASKGCEPAKRGNRPEPDWKKPVTKEDLKKLQK